VMMVPLQFMLPSLANLGQRFASAIAARAGAVGSA